MSGDDHGRTRMGTAVAFGLFGLILAAVIVAAVSATLIGLSFAEARDSFVVTNSVIALSCALAGVLIAWQRPRNPVGWLLLATGCAQGLTAAFAPVALAGPAREWPVELVGTAATIASFSWPSSIGLFLPLALLLFPNGRLPGPRWRPVVVLLVVTGALFIVEHGADPAGFIGDGRGAAWVVLSNHAELSWLWTVTEIGNGLLYLAVLLGLVVRYRRGDERIRGQLLWLVLAGIGMIAMLAVWVPIQQDGPLVLILLVIPLLPAAITIAILRYQLLDIRLVISRAVLYTLLTGGVIGLYLTIVGLADSVLRQQAGLGTSVVATLIIALVFNPVRVRLQRLVDRALYGDRAEPVLALSRVGAHLAATPAGEGDVLATVREALRLPYAALHSDGAQRAADGTRPARCESVPLTYRGESIGELTVGVRVGQHQLDPPDRAVLELLAAPLAIAMRANALAEAVQRSRSEIVAAREEERRRLRRDLHDGLGPVLTGMAFTADAARNLLRADPDRADDLLAELRNGATEAINDIRRLVYALRPPSLDELGLLGALRRHVEHLGTAGVSVAIDAPAELPTLPAAVEVAAYRIATEALNNAIRHGHASHVDLQLVLDGELAILVTDNGAGEPTVWAAGVGLTSMTERAAELGGQVETGPVPGGGRVRAMLPL